MLQPPDDKEGCDDHHDQQNDHARNDTSQRPARETSQSEIGEPFRGQIAFVIDDVGCGQTDTRRSTRNDLRSQLIWNGFGLLQNGLWIAPGKKDVTDIITSLELGDHVTVLTAGAFKPTETADLVRKAFDLERIARRYRAFLAQWDVPQPLPSAPDDLARQLLLHTDWLQLVRQDPHLPAEHLPHDWPAIRAEQLFQVLARKYEQPAAEQAAAVLDLLPV